MSGSRTCADVCDELGVPCVAWDIHSGFDACDPRDFPPEGNFDFVWAHPPYWRQKLYADDPRDLSRAPRLDEFLRRYGQFVRNCARSLKPGERLAFAAGLRQDCTDIVRFSHGASSGKKAYASSFIPVLHDTCVVFAKT